MTPRDDAAPDSVHTAGRDAARTTARDAVPAAMRRALAASDLVHGTTSPNPAVGCVVLDRAGAVVGTGATTPPGGPHAERVALAEAGDRAAGGTAVVTLEPCNHSGRTPPCVDGLLEAGIARVYAALADPNPVAAGGLDRLRAAGIEVTLGTLAGEVGRGPLRGWLHRQHTGRPHVTWKVATTLDGRVAAADGTSRWITGPEARGEVHDLRRRMDAIVAGTGTVLDDDPALTARRPDGTLFDHQPLRVVVGHRDVPPGARLSNRAAGEAEVVHLRTRDPGEVLAELVRRDTVDVLLEGGPTLAGAFVAAGAVDRVLVHLAPALLGAGPHALGDAGVGTIADIVRLQVDEVRRSGGDVVIDGRPAPAPIG
ncbi:MULTISPECIES: bifunctional diaminohydroxyphosphoribosylaminopyrimidine deaminase/5-amino-6-(5-phosphoribosylamino)uracil reductase RibD [unclassified Pseudonocardia]|uniref:bifunctional diaminohydroxyphosphoribosylaminopyrimidine deaminase/5-amino-6-(5-phosphoribosylamino)uracil reductase RibD n=1 Tax=Pseudonocardia sp. P1 TaxID=761194 RepID=UPI0001FFEDD2|nr:Diaminohydroxyphosphoribosylaminopyrimidine deaminase [Pseudonocardia sp. Ae707_Ps1]